MEELIKEVEKIVEVPVDRIVEVPVDRIVEKEIIIGNEGITDYKKTYIVKIDDFTPYFYIMLPDHCRKSSCNFIDKWGRNKIWKKYD